jgi:virginiamycin B lyase
MTYKKLLGTLGIPCALLASFVLLLASPAAFAQGSGKMGNLSGKVTADQGTVRAFRVKARDTLHQISFTVFTVNGEYHIYNLPASMYDVQVIEPGYDAPVQKVDLSKGGAATADITLTTKAPPKSNVQLVDYDEAYPPGHGRDVLQHNCTGCHGRTAWLRFGPHSEDEWKEMIQMKSQWVKNIPMIPSDDLTPEDSDAIVKYFTENLGPNSTLRGLKKDTLVRDEDTLGKAMYIEWELVDPPEGKTPEGRPRTRGLHSPALAPDGMVYWSGSTGSDSILRLDPKNLDFETRYKEWIVPVNGKYSSHPSGIEVWDGKVYFSENLGDGIGVLDPKTDTITRYKTPAPGGAMTNYPDSKGNMWYTVIRGGGGRIGKFDIVTHKAEDWSPVYGAIFYGITVDRKDRVWAAGLRKSVVVEYDPKSEKFIPYYTSTEGSGPRRITTDSKGKVWFGEYFAGKIGTIDPDTGKMTEYTEPLKNTSAYGISPDAQDNIWASDDFYESLVKFDPKTGKFTYVPFPTLAQVDAPKLTLAKDGTIWFYPRGRNSKIVEGFQPAGNTPKACYPWMSCPTTMAQAK